MLFILITWGTRGINFCQIFIVDFISLLWKMETSRYAESPEWYEVMLDHYPPPEPEVLQIYHLGMTGVEGRYQIDQRAKQVVLTAYAQEDVRC